MVLPRPPRTGAAVLPLSGALALLSAFAAGSLAAAAEQTLSGEEVQCLEGVGADGAACAEEQVEAAEEALAERMSMQLLQTTWSRRDNKALGTGDREEATAEPLEQQAEQGPTEAAAALEQDLAWDGEDGEDQEPAVNCSQHPVFCSAKLDCAAKPLTEADRKSWSTRLATKDGHANFRSWCMVYPMYADSLGKCIVDDDKNEYARIMYEDQEKAKLNSADAVYCFVAGHCNSSDVTLNTTTQDAEQICDNRYGKRWKNVGWDDFMGVVARAQQSLTDGTKALKDGSKTWSDLLALARREAEISAMTSCAMGIYQCDVFYCKNNYCQNPLYRGMFGNMSWA